MADEAVANAEVLLKYLADKAEKNWVKVMGDTLTEGERAATHAQIGNILGPLGRDTPYGAFAGGTGGLKEAAGLEGERAQEAIKFLKLSHRLLQIGKGRGRCLIALNVDPFTPEEIEATMALMNPAPVAKKAAPRKAAPAKAKDEDQLDSVTAMFRAMERVVEDLQRQQKENSELKSLLAEFDKLKKASAWA